VLCTPLHPWFSSLPSPLSDISRRTGTTIKHPSSTILTCDPSAGTVTASIRFCGQSKYIPPGQSCKAPVRPLFRGMTRHRDTCNINTTTVHNVHIPITSELRDLIQYENSQWNGSERAVKHYDMLQAPYRNSSVGTVTTL